MHTDDPQHAWRQIRGFVGSERSVQEVSRSLYFACRELKPAAVGAMLITCADESEHECADAFQTGFSQYLLPELKFAHRSAFRLANLGGRYEWGAVRIAEDHFVTAETENSDKLLVCKINAHVAVEEENGAPRFGIMTRYQRPSACCGAMQALMGNAALPFASDLREAFRSEGVDRLAALLDPKRVAPDERPLLAAVVSARLQARRAMLDIQDYRPASPTFYIVVASVTLNRRGTDGEIVCGVYTADHRREGERQESYFGLGDDPAAYTVSREGHRLRIDDDALGNERKARNHRRLVAAAWEKERPTAVRRDERLQKVWKAVAEKKHLQDVHCRTLLKTSLLLLSQVSPVPAAVILFAHGAAAIHHVHRAHGLTHRVASDDDARRILAEVESQLDHLDAEKARDVLEVLARHHA